MRLIEGKRGGQSGYKFDGVSKTFQASCHILTCTFLILARALAIKSTLPLEETYFHLLQGFKFIDKLATLTKVEHSLSQQTSEPRKWSVCRDMVVHQPEAFIGNSALDESWTLTFRMAQRSPLTT